MHHRLAAPLVLLLHLAFSPWSAGPASAQDGASRESAAPEGAGWNSARALELMEAASARRSAPRADSGLTSYQARAEGFVYFFLDREDTDERTLVKVDQIALDVFWAAPNRTKQRIVGMRDARRLPSDIHYHLDHLTVVQDEFGDVIRIGDGDEVRDVLHPAAPGAGDSYDFRLTDSLSIHLSGAPEPIRVYELQVRPRRPHEPAFIGSVFVDRASSAIVRMTFTFTAASYVDARLDYIRISLDNGLWEGRYWLPHEQRLEIRRQFPALDFPAGGVIRGNLRIATYTLNEELPPELFVGPPVVAVPSEIRESFPFEEDIFAELNREGLASPPELAGLERKALALLGRQRLSGLPRLRLWAPGASSIVRYNRVEGLYAGAGVMYAPSPRLRLGLLAGHSSGRGAPSVEAVARSPLGAGREAELSLYHDRLADLGPFPGAAGLINTLSAAVAGTDFLDPYLATGAMARFETPIAAGWRARALLRGEDHASAELNVAAAPAGGSRRFRPVRPVAEGRFTSFTGEIERITDPAARASWSVGASVEVGTLEGAGFVRPIARGALLVQSPDRHSALELTATAGAGGGELPPQRLFLLGGRATLPGHEYRAFSGDRMALLTAELSRDILDPWVRLRLLGAAGWSGFGSVTPPPEWPGGPTDGVRASVGAGLGLVYDVARIDLARGLNGGGWKLLLSVHPRFRDIL